MSIIKFDIINHADYCGEFRGDKYIPGLQKFYAAIESIREKNPENSLLLDAGDEINRLLWYGKDVFDGLALIRTDCMTIGNHEFDRGQKQLEDNIAHIHDKLPILCSNVTYKGTDQFIKNVKPYNIIEKSGVKFGILGLTTEYSEFMITYPNFEPFEMHSCSEACHRFVPELREKGCEIIILLCHIGTDHNEGLQGELKALYENTRDLDIDMIIGGHNPGDVAGIYGNTVINKGGFSGKSLLHTALYFDDESRKIVRAEPEAIDVVNYKPEKYYPEIDEFVNRILEPLSFYFEDEFAYAKEDVLMSASSESAQGDLFADAIRWKAKVDFAYFNCTSCGPRIPEGPITRYTIKQAIYFDEPIHVSTMTGREIYELFEIVHNTDIFPKNACLYFSGLKVKIDATRKNGNMVVYIRHLDDTDLKKDEVLTVATSEYMASGGNATRPIAQSRKWTALKDYIHESIKDYLAMVKEIDNSIDNRFIFIKENQINKETDYFEKL